MLDRRQFLAAAGASAWRLHCTLAARARSTSGPLACIDAHVHVFKTDPRFPFAPGVTPPAQNAPVETLMELMRTNSVSRTVLIQIIHYKWDNSYLADVLNRFPALFQGVCRVNPEDPAAPDQLSDLTQQGFRGVRLSPAANATGDWIRGPLMPPLWHRCSQLKVPMTLLTPVSRLPDIVPLLETNPDLDVVIDHMAMCPLHQPEQLKLLLDLARYPRVYIKISGLWEVSTEPYPYHDAQQQLKRIRDAFGAERLMWATNWPVSLKQLPYNKAVELYRDHISFFSPQEREQVLYKTVQKLWPFEIS